MIPNNHIDYRRKDEYLRKYFREMPRNFENVNERIRNEHEKRFLYPSHAPSNYRYASLSPQHNYGYGPVPDYAFEPSPEQNPFQTHSQPQRCSYTPRNSEDQKRSPPTTPVISQSLPILRQRIKPKKTTAVYKAHTKITEIFRTFNIRHVKKVFGNGIVRVCCRTFDQLDAIPALIQGIVQTNYIQEIGMPLDYKCNMKCIMIFIKPVNENLSKKIEKYFEQTIYNYKVRIFDIQDKLSVSRSVSKSPVKNCEERKPVKKVVVEVVKKFEWKKILTFTVKGAKIVLEIFILLLLFIIGAILLSELAH